MGGCGISFVTNIGNQIKSSSLHYDITCGAGQGAELYLFPIILIKQTCLSRPRYLTINQKHKSLFEQIILGFVMLLNF